MKRLEAFSRLYKFQQAVETQSMTAMAEAVGITDDLAETMSFTDFADAMAVRVANLMRVAGFDPTGGDQP